MYENTNSTVLSSPPLHPLWIFFLGVVVVTAVQLNESDLVGLYPPSTVNCAQGGPHRYSVLLQLL